MNPVISVAAASYAARTGAIRWRGYSLVEADVNSKVLRVITSRWSNNHVRSYGGASRGRGGYTPGPKVCARKGTTVSMIVLMT